MGNIVFELKKAFRPTSLNGRVFTYLKRVLEGGVGESVINLVRVVYIPLVLADEGANDREIQKAVIEAREFVETKLQAAIGLCASDSEPPQKMFGSQTVCNNQDSGGDNHDSGGDNHDSGGDNHDFQEILGDEFDE